MDKVVHFEIPAEDMARAQKFYEQAFGWKIDSIPSMGYALITTTPTDEKRMPLEPGAINGGMMQRKDPITSPVMTISVQDIDAGVKKAEKAGGNVIIPKFKVGEIGYSAYMKDTEGNMIGLWQDIKP